MKTATLLPAIVALFLIGLSPISRADNTAVIHTIGHWNITWGPDGAGITTTNHQRHIALTVLLSPRAGCDATTTLYTIPVPSDSPLQSTMLLTSEFRALAGNQTFVGAATITGDKGDKTITAGATTQTYIDFHGFLEALKHQPRLTVILKKPSGTAPLNYDLRGFKAAFSYAQHYCLDSL